MQPNIGSSCSKLMFQSAAPPRSWPFLKVGQFWQTNLSGWRTSRKTKASKAASVGGLFRRSRVALQNPRLLNHAREVRDRLFVDDRRLRLARLSGAEKIYRGRVCVRGRAPSITKTERRRSANLQQMPRGLMCKLRQRGRCYGSPAASRGIDPSLQPPPWRAYMGSADALLSGSISDVGVNGFVR